MQPGGRPNQAPHNLDNLLTAPSVQQTSPYLETTALESIIETQNLTTRQRVEDALVVWSCIAAGSLMRLRAFAQAHAPAHPQGGIIKVLPTFQLALTDSGPETNSSKRPGHPTRTSHCRLRLADIMHDICQLHVDAILPHLATHPRWSPTYQTEFLNDLWNFCAHLAAAELEHVEGTEEAKAAANRSGPTNPLDERDVVHANGDFQRRWFMMQAAPVNREVKEAEDQDAKDDKLVFVHRALSEYFFAWYNVMLSARSLEAQIQRLGAIRFAHIPRLLHLHAELAADFPDLQQLYASIVLQSRKPHEDPEQDERLVTAATNAISILNHGATHGLLPSRFVTHRDWREIRVPHANLSNAQILHCQFDGADLSHAMLSNAHFLGSSFAGANLRHARLPLLMQFTGLSNTTQRVCFSADGTQLAVGSRDSTLIYDLQARKLARTLTTLRLSAHALAFCSNDTRRTHSLLQYQDRELSSSDERG